MIDFGPFRKHELTMQELARGLTRADLVSETMEMVRQQQAIVADATDHVVVFVPDDPEANDTFAGSDQDVKLAWTLAHVVVHTTASSEESCAIALNLARGVAVEGRSRFEVPWESVATVAQMNERLEDSLRMRIAMLEAWPAQPDLENSYNPYPRQGPINAVARVLFGLSHDASHIEQLREIVRQAKAAAR
jgi:hypothetical protein